MLAICDKTGIDFSKMKLFFDCTCVIWGIVLSLLLEGGIYYGN